MHLPICQITHLTLRQAKPLGNGWSIKVSKTSFILYLGILMILHNIGIFYLHHQWTWWGKCLKNNQVKQLVGLPSNIHYLINQDDKEEHDPTIFSPVDSENWSKETALNLQTYLVRSLKIPSYQGMRSPYTNTLPQSSASLQLIPFNRSIKREITAYSVLKDEKNFKSYNRRVHIMT